MKRKILFLFNLLFATLLGAQSEFYSLDSPIAISTGYRSSASSWEISQLIQRTKVTYTSNDLSKIQKLVDKNNIAVSKALSDIESKATYWRTKIQEMIALRDIEATKQVISDLEKSKKQAETELEKSLRSTKHSGVYLAILRNIDPYTSRNDLVKKAQKVIINQAIDDLNVTYINRLSKVKDYAQVSDIVSAMKDGKVTFQEEIKALPYYEEKIFIYAVKVYVEPNGTAAGSSYDERKYTSNEAPEDAFVINATIDSRASNMARSEGVNRDDAVQLRGLISQRDEIIKTENESMDKQQQLILEKSTSEIQKIEQNIAGHKQDLSRRINQIKSMLEEIGDPKLNFNNLRPQQSADDAISYFQSQIVSLNKQWDATKEYEISMKETNKKIEGEVHDEIANECVKLCEQLQKNYTELTKNIETVIVEDFKIKEYQNSGTKKTFRDVNQLWIYPIPQNDGSFRIVLFAKYKIR